MALQGVHPGGAPRYVAVIPFSIAEKQGLIQEFYDACSDFRYRDIMALSRALNLTPQTIQNYKYKTQFPRWEIANDIIKWVKAGKPMERVSQSNRPSPVLM